MRTVSATVYDYLTKRRGIHAESLVWIGCKDRDTGAAAPIGFWTGDDHQTFTIRGDSRLYYGAGTVVGLDPITLQTGLTVRMQRITLALTAPEVVEAMRARDPRFAVVEVHRALFDLDSGALLDEPRRVFRGMVDAAPLPTPEVGGAAHVEMSVASAARWLTRALPIKKSDAALRKRSATDDFRKYADYAGEVEVWWGDGKQRVPDVVKPSPAGSVPMSHWGGGYNR